MQVISSKITGSPSSVWSPPGDEITHGHHPFVDVFILKISPVHCYLERFIRAAHICTVGN
jgi:hypothetical protein